MRALERKVQAPDIVVAGAEEEAGTAEVTGA